MSQTEKVAFALENEKDGLTGTVSVDDGKTFDVGEALAEGNGRIVVVRGSALEHSLAGFVGLKRESAEASETAVNEEAAAEDPGVQVNASQAAISKAAELGVDLDEVEGTGSGGAIKVSDVEEAAAAADDEADDGEEG